MNFAFSSASKGRLMEGGRENQAYRPFNFSIHTITVSSWSADQSGSASVVPDIVEVMGGEGVGGGGGKAGSGAWSIRHVSSQKKGGGGEAEKGAGCRFNAPVSRNLQLSGCSQVAFFSPPPSPVNISGGG